VTRNALVTDLALAVLAAIVVLILTPGVAIAAMIAILVCSGAWPVSCSTRAGDRRERRGRRRPAGVRPRAGDRRRVGEARLLPVPSVADLGER
jgi:hypothetical protein